MAQDIDTLQHKVIPIENDSSFYTNDSLTHFVRDSVKIKDSTQIDSTRKKSILKYDMKQGADSIMRWDFKEKKLYLYDKAYVEYGDMKLTAGNIVMDNNKHEVFARGIIDSSGAYSQKPVFTQGNREVIADSILYNVDSKKALIYNFQTEESEFKVKGEVSKRVNDSVLFIDHATFTTSEDLEDPEYYFLAQKIKLVPGKKVVSGLVNMYIEGVPTPLGLPFGYFPLAKHRSSGFIIPSIGNTRDRGYSLQNGGYYFAISDYFDLAVLGDYYSNNSYGLRLQSNYAKRYKFNGNFSFRYEKLLTSERGFPDFSENTIYNIRWSHSQDPKSSPNSRFSASVNMGSSKYYRESLNQMNSGNFLNNNLSSSISYSKTFPGEPQFRFSVTATHNQNTQTQEINMTLPTLDASISRIYPFAPKDGIKKGFIDNINFQYHLRGENRFRTTDSLFFTPKMFRNAKTGIQQSIPLSTNFKLFKHLSVSMGANYNETWVFNTFKQSYDTAKREVVTDTMRGFDSYRTYNFNASIGTTVYGIFKFGKDSKIQAIRHVIKPSISYSLTPSFEKFYDTYLIPATSGLPQEVVEYSRFANTLFGAPNKEYASSIGFSITNDFEAKIRKSDSIGAEPEKRKLLSNLRFSTAYNLAADSLNLQPITFSGTLPIIKDKLSINFNGALDPYALNNNNQRINKLNIENGGSLLRLTRGNISFNYSFSNSDFGGKEKDAENETYKNGGRKDDLFGKSMNSDGTFGNQQKDEEPKENKTKRYHYKIPWSLRLAYTMTYNNLHRENEISSHSIMFSADVELSPRWKVGLSSGYDIKNHGFTYTQLRFERDLKSWRMSFNWTPFGVRQSWYFFIGIKASVLSSIKYDKHREPDRRL